MSPHYGSGRGQQDPNSLSDPSNCPPQQQDSAYLSSPSNCPPQQHYPPTHKKISFAPSPFNTSYLHGNHSMNGTYSHNSSDSGYATRSSSNSTYSHNSSDSGYATQPSYQIPGYPTQSYSAQSYPTQSYPTQSYPAQNYAPNRQLNQQNAVYPYDNQQGFDIEVIRTASISPKHTKRELSPPSPTSPSEYPCLYPGCRHISSRPHDLRRHMIIHFPPNPEPLFDCRYEWCGRTGAHGFRKEDHRKEHYRKVHAKASEYPKTGKGGGSGRKSRDGGPAGSKTNQIASPYIARERIERMEKIFKATEGVSPSGNTQASKLVTEAVERPGSPKQPVLKGSPPAQDGAEHREAHTMASEYSQLGKGGSERRSIIIPTASKTYGVVYSDSADQEGTEKISKATEGVSLSDNIRASRLVTETVERPGSPKTPVLKGSPPAQDGAELKVSASDPDATTSDALNAIKVEHVEWTATTTDEEETQLNEESETGYGSDAASVHEEVEEGILDDLGADSRFERRHPTETAPGRTETLTTPALCRTSQDKLAVVKCQILDTMSGSKADQFCVLLKMQWDILGFMRDQFLENDFPNAALGLVITINGSAQHAQAITCSDYIRQTWPAHGSQVLDALQGALNSPTHTSHLKTSIGDKSVPGDGAPPSGGIELYFEFTGEVLQFYVISGTPNIIVEVVQQLVWMGTALRTSKDDTVQYCESTLERVFNFQIMNSATFNVIFHMNPLGNRDQSCWLPLFTNPVIAYGFPTAIRNNHEVGLEIPLDMMAALGGARHAVTYEGGLVLKGYSAIFVPVKRHEESVQWHLIRGRDDDRILYREASVQCPNRLLLESLDHEALRTTRAYLGWWKKAEIHLGTADADYKSIDWSSAGEAKRLTRFSGANIGFQTMITGQLHFIPGAKDGGLHFSQKGPFQRIVQRAEQTPVVLYDVEDHRAWLVRALDVMLHVVQTRHHSSPYKSDGRNVELYPVIAEKGKGAAAEAAAANQLRQLYERDATAEKDYYYKDVLLDIWSQMDLLMEKEDSIEASPGVALHGTMRSKIHGWEYMSLVQEKNYRRKEANVKKSSGGWVDLIKDIGALVLFATGFDEIIRPTSDLSSLCHPWRTLPKGKDHLAAGVPILELLYSEAGSRTSRKHLSASRLQWHRGSTLFEQCRGTMASRCECDRTQQIYHDSLFKTFGHVRPPGNLEADGCVVFGQAFHPFKTSKIITRRQNAVHLLPNNSIQNDEATKQVSNKNDGILFPAPRKSVSPEPKEANGHVIPSPQSRPSPPNFTNHIVHHKVVTPKKIRQTSYTKISKLDTCKGPDECNHSSHDETMCTVEYQPTLMHAVESEKQKTPSTQTTYASEIGHAPANNRKTIRRKPKLEDCSHLHGCSCGICSTVCFEPPDSTEVVSITDCARRNSTNIERGERPRV